jgi:hypothetical protein
MQILEHIHVNVDSIAATETFLQLALPQLRRRGGGNAAGYGQWLHIGNEQQYIALTEKKGAKLTEDFRHIGLVVDSVEALMARLAVAGMQPSDVSALDEHPYRRRVYYIDGNGLDWEFVEYLSEDLACRNDYSH